GWKDAARPARSCHGYRPAGGVPGVRRISLDHRGSHSCRRRSRCGHLRRSPMKRTESTSSPQVPKRTQPEEFDLVILGGGTGSTIAAWTFAGEGKHVAVVERKYIGGACPDNACLSRKTIIPHED